jgi:hypothetical protein
MPTSHLCPCFLENEKLKSFNKSSLWMGLTNLPFRTLGAGVWERGLHQVPGCTQKGKQSTLGCGACPERTCPERSIAASCLAYAWLWQEEVRGLGRLSLGWVHSTDSEMSERGFRALGREDPCWSSMRVMVRGLSERNSQHCTSGGLLGMVGQQGMSRTGLLT